ncbi:MAG: MFS transporter, partial [Planctomycetota bacterium]|jgi:hypothetical protein
MGFKLITATMNWGQFVEMFIMLTVPIILASLGIKWAMSVGLVALLARYLFFLFGGMYDQSWMYFGGILVHGIIYAYFFVGGQVYVDKKAPSQIRAQAQGFIFLITFGIGLLVGNFFNGELIERNSSTGGIEAPGTLMLAASEASVSITPTIDGATISDLKLYNKRALLDTEVEVLASSERKANNLIDEAKSKGLEVDIETGLISKEDFPNSIDQINRLGFTFSAKVILPEDNPDTEDDDVLSGTLVNFGHGKNSMKVTLENNTLVIHGADAQIIAKTVSIKRGEDKPMYIAGTFDGEKMRFFTDGIAYRLYNWKPIWTVTSIISAILLVLFIIVFHYREPDAGKAVVQTPPDESNEKEAVLAVSSEDSEKAEI